MEIHGGDRNLSLNAGLLNNSQPTAADMQWSCVKFKTNQEQICRQAKTVDRSCAP